jgi:dihydrodipicolinate synthase/N-acetylneuraminate lyase
MLKATMELIGLAGGPVRPPRVDLTAVERGEIETELQRLGILGA